MCSWQLWTPGVDIGDYGSNADGAIWSRSAFGQALEHGELDLPPPKPLPNWPAGGVFPHVFVGDEAIPQGKSWCYGKDQTNLQL